MISRSIRAIIIIITFRQSQSICSRPAYPYCHRRVFSRRLLYTTAAAASNAAAPMITPSAVAAFSPALIPPLPSLPRGSSLSSELMSCSSTRGDDGVGAGEGGVSGGGAGGERWFWADGEGDEERDSGGGAGGDR